MKVGWATTPSAAHQATYFFKNSAFEYVFLTSLGRAYHQAGDVGKVLYIARQVPDGDFQSAYNALIAAGHEARALAEESANGKHVESARQAYLWAQNFYDAATYFADGTGDPARIRTAWQWMDDCWLKSGRGRERRSPPTGRAPRRARGRNRAGTCR